MIDRSSVRRLGLFTVVLAACIGALVMLSMNQNVEYQKLSTPHHPASAEESTKHKSAVSADGSTNHRRVVSAHETTDHKPVLLIVGYLRTGSTFTASLFAQHPETFYVFEPLHMLSEMVKKKRLVRYINGTVRYFSSPQLDQDVARQALQHWMQCGFGSLDRDSLQDGFHYTYSKSMRPFVMCIRQRMARLKVGFSFAIKDCLPPTVRKCSTAKLRVFKTIRLRMASAEKLMRLNPNLKVIHLVRDPRGMMHSQVRTKLVGNGSETTAVETFCSIIMADIAVSKRLLREGEKNLYVVRYEDIAYNPMSEMELLYKFVNMTVDRRIQNYVRQSTSMNLRDSCAYCTRRGNSTRTANRWRDKISSSFVNRIDNYCDDVYSNLGYIPLDVNDIRNQSIPSMSSESLYDIMLDKSLRTL